MKTTVVLAIILVAMGLSAQTGTSDKDIIIPKEVTKVQKFKTASCPVGYEGHYISGSWKEQDDTAGLTGNGGWLTTSVTLGSVEINYQVCVTKGLMDELRKQNGGK